MEPKKKKVIDLTVIDQLMQSGVDAIALVEDPAIEINFLAFKREEFVKPRAGEDEGEFIGRCMSAIEGEFPDQDQRLAVCYSYWEGGFEQFESYDDYPEAAKANAQRALDWAEENGWGGCGTAVGKQRANQLAKGEPISEETISRMASFARHKQNSDTPYGEGCGKLMWDAWGGTEGIEWASRKLEQIEKEKMEIVVNAPAPYVDQTGESNKKKKKPILEAKPTLMSEEIPTPDYSKEDMEILKALAEGLGFNAKDATFVENFATEDPVEVLYRYEGSEIGERDFCDDMLSTRDLMYTREDINMMSFSNANPGFGHKGRPYSIFKYKGGPFCKHYWQKYERNTVTGELRRVPDSELNDIERIARTAPHDMAGGGRYPGTFSKMYFEETEDKRILVGPAMVPNMEIPRYDKKTNEIFYVSFSEEAVAKIAEKFMREQSTHNTNQDHDMEKPADTYIFESWLVEDPATDKANTVYGYDVPAGTWMVKMRVNSDAVWQRVKSGELRGFSVEGNFVTEEELADIEAAGLLSRISEIIA